MFFSAAVWSLSALISIPPLFGWKAEPKEGLCVVSQAIGYQFLATIGAFYFPLTIMIIIYTKIYLVSSRIANAEARSKPTITYNDEQQTSGASGMATLLRKDSQVGQDKIMHQIEENHNIQNGNKKTREFSIGEILPNALAARSNRSAAKKLRFNRPSASNERKATKTLGVIMGAFTACWLPFFILALIKPFCSNPETCIPHWLNGLFLWLGYTNSFLNPIIYARFNRDFRTPFKHILQCHCRDINSRLRSENFNEQYGRPDQQQQQHSCTSDAAQVRYSICRGQSVIKLPWIVRNNSSLQEAKTELPPLKNTQNSPPPRSCNMWLTDIRERYTRSRIVGVFIWRAFELWARYMVGVWIGGVVLKGRRLNCRRVIWWAFELWACYIWWAFELQACYMVGVWIVGVLYGGRLNCGRVIYGGRLNCRLVDWWTF